MCIYFLEMFEVSCLVDSSTSNLPLPWGSSVWCGSPQPFRGDSQLSGLQPWRGTRLIPDSEGAGTEERTLSRD